MSFRRWTHSTVVRATAAGILIAATSAVITLYTVRGGGAGTEKSFATGALGAGGRGVNTGWAVPIAGSPGDMYRGAVPVEALGGVGPAGGLAADGGGDGLNGALAVEVPIAMHGHNTPGGAGGIGDWMPVSNDPLSRRSVVIQPDGQGNAVVIPVSTVNLKFY